MAERYHGPYEHRPGQWRIVGVSADGVRLRQTFTSKEEADREIAKARAGLGQRTVGTAVTDYLEHMKEKGRRQGTRDTARYRLTAFLRLVEGDRMLSSLTPAVACALYAKRMTEVKPDTHRGELALASTWASWCVKSKWLAANPFEGVEPMGEKSRGKDQLRLDEAKRFLATCLKEETPSATACALALLTGARASEVTERVVRDLDDGGRLLWIPFAKTSAGVRQLLVPELLRARVLQLAEGRKPDERLWGSVTRHWLGHHVRRLCGVAKVPVVSPHGLRGLNATLRVQSGESTETVARLLGQAGPGVTRRHYLQPGTEETVQSAALLARLTEAEEPDED